MSDAPTQLETDIASAIVTYGPRITAVAEELHRRVATMPAIKCRILATLFVMQATAQSDGLSRDFLEGLVEDPLDVHPGQLARQDLITGAHDQPYRLTAAGEELVMPCLGTLPPWEHPGEKPADDALAMAHAEIEQLREELGLFKDRVAGEKAILLRIRTAEAKVESAKMALSSEKERLSQAHDELAAFIAQEPGKQQEIPFGEQPVNDGAMGWFEQGAAAFNQGRHLDTCALPLGESRLAWERGWRDARVQKCGGGPIASASLSSDIEALLESLGDELPVSEKPVTVSTIEHLDRDWIVYRGCGTKPTESRHVIVPLYTKDEWNQLHADTYGNPVAGFDQDNGARDRRQKGGIDCGRTVKVGRKSLIVGPLSDACWVGVAVQADGEEG